MAAVIRDILKIGLGLTLAWFLIVVIHIAGIYLLSGYVWKLWFHSWPLVPTNFLF